MEWRTFNIPKTQKIILLLAPPLCYTMDIVKGGEGNDDREGDEEILQSLQMQGLLLKYCSGSFLRREGALILIKNNRKRGTGSKACFFVSCHVGASSLPT